MSEVKDMTVYMRGSKLVLSYDYKTGRINVLSGDLEHVFCDVGGCINGNVIGGINGDVLVGINGNVFGGVNGDVDE